MLFQLHVPIFTPVFFTFTCQSEKNFAAFQKTGWVQRPWRWVPVMGGRSPFSSSEWGLVLLGPTGFPISTALITLHAAPAWSVPSSDVSTELWKSLPRRGLSLVSGFPARQWVTRGHVPSQMVLYFWRGRGSVTICFLHVVSPEPEPIWINLCPIFSFMLHPTNLWDKRPLLHFTVWHTLGLNPWVEPNWPSTYLWAFA